MARKRENSEKIPWVKITLTPEERFELRTEPPELTKLYLIINERRDFKTNIAGIRTHISDRTFKEGMEIAAKQGRKKWRPKTSLIQRWLSQLEGLGLIEPRGNYVFYCPMAYQKESDKILSDQTATTSATTSATKLDHTETTINKDVSGGLENEVRPEVLPQVLPQLYTPQGSTVATLHTVGEKENSDDGIPEFSVLSPYRELISQQGFRFDQILNKETIAMISAWIKAGVTIKEAQIGIESSNAKFEIGRPSSPLYYFQPILEVKDSFKKASNLAKESKHAQRKPVQASQQRYKSATQAFFDDTTDALERNYSNRKSD